MNYSRVLPRDLFNEAKLLKCMGRLCLLIHDRIAPKEMTFRQNGDPFEITLLPTGELFIDNLHVKIRDTFYIFKTTYNSKSNYPLFMEHELTDYDVFDDEGNFDKEFLELLKQLP